ncbi:ATP-binding cassette sub-family C member 8-like [Ptychodera flava]|uniref:ATP-binding cassette sub-family C member 8-like n=1 Tax=Ptychodera flava TaxID=63121 RepID=UPI00396A7270
MSDCDSFAIGGVISYATREYFSEEQPTENLCYVTINEFFSNGYVLVLVICVSMLARAILLRLSHIMFDWYAIRVQSALQAFTYEKSLHLSTSSLSSGDMTVGQITNHMSVDATAIFWFTMYQPWLWTGPIMVVVVITLLYYEMGVSALIGAAFIPVFGVVQYKITDILARLKNLVLKTSDRRLKKINELLQGMKLLKLCGWEEVFCSSIEGVREQQVKLMMKSGAYMIVSMSTAKTLTAMVTLIVSSDILIT